MAEKLGGISWLFSKFGFRFLLPQNMKSSSIYRGWKRDVWSPLVPNLDPWFDQEESQPLAQSSHHGQSGLLQENGWLGWSFWGDATVSVMSVDQN